MSKAHRFSFTDGNLKPTVAHGGRGEITFARIRDRVPGSGCNWLDMSVLPPGASIGVHTHGLDDEEIYIVITGRGRMTLGSESFVVEAGDVVINPPGGTHALENVGDEDLRLFVIDVCYRPDR